MKKEKEMQPNRRPHFEFTTLVLIDTMTLRHPRARPADYTQRLCSEKKR